MMRIWLSLASQFCVTRRGSRGWRDLNKQNKFQGSISCVWNRQ